MNDSVRHKKIADILHDQPFVSVRELQNLLGVSAATVRRDIDKINDTGSARKVYGGIAALESSKAHTAYARPYDENRDLAVDAKQAIAALAATMVDDGDSVIVNGGSTCFYFGMMLANRNIKLHTNSMPLAAFLAEHGSCNLHLAGGNLHREPRVMYCPNQPLTFFGSKYFVGAQGISGEGLLESHPLMVRSMQETSLNADQIIVLADSRKFSIHARNLALPLSRLDTLITDDGLTDNDAQMLEDAGVTVRIATGGEVE